MSNVKGPTNKPATHINQPPSTTEKKPPATSKNDQFDKSKTTASSTAPAASPAPPVRAENRTDGIVNQIVKTVSDADIEKNMYALPNVLSIAYNVAQQSTKDKRLLQSIKDKFNEVLIAHHPCKGHPEGPQRYYREFLKSSGVTNQQKLEQDVANLFSQFALKK